MGHMVLFSETNYKKVKPNHIRRWYSKCAIHGAVINQKQEQIAELFIHTVI